jgi:hypothetical protein
MKSIHKVCVCSLKATLVDDVLENCQSDLTGDPLNDYPDLTLDSGDTESL